ncbi:MAG: metal ABC transporter substrate-binding protein [Dehalococcoidia bacterium]|nr:metal ABC transporter substrate-binding protein [Dehalococcoidia bacterium]
MPFRRTVPVALLLGLSLLFAACGADGDAGEGTLVMATTSQIGALAREVVGSEVLEGGETVEVATLLAPGVNPHDYEPSPAEVARLSRAAVVLRNGIGLDDFLDGAIAGAGVRHVVTVTDGIALRSTDRDAQDHDDDAEHGEHAEDDGHRHEGDLDPHVWHDPERVQVMVANIADALAEAFPERAAAFRANADAYAQRLDEVDAEVRALLETVPVEHRKVVSAHDSLGYFLDRYGLQFVGAVIPATASGAEASVRALAELQGLIEREGVRAIFAESSVDPRLVERLAEDTGVRVVTDLYSDTLGPEGSGADTVDGMLLHNARRIAEALR